ncbi:outer membrane lipoprotein-sorting protein [Neolewinella aurantiaca]|uniref:Outer membrane lipoprotein-sorting protein n=1 Tax=Neolewinella aurantiaca TaxID=2602767 RepID=A0A5C7FUS6_9BACT|nr:outer membrane lipoprotein-sorting protein [Neolewinella aurantiaca]TXF90360.1 outer membrane lipoprotein-sorting protein [Neolewinella aurantiaca]
MKKLFTLTLMLVFVTGLFAQKAPTAEEIAATYIENIGGADAWKALKATTMKGTASMQGMEFPISITAAEGDMQYVEVNVQGQKIVQAYDGETAWQIMPFQGITEPTEMPEDQAEQSKEMRFLSEFIDSKERGITLESVEGKEVEGTPTYGVRVTDEKGIDHTYYFDQEYMIPVMMASSVKSGPQKGAVVETYMSDYQEVEGLVVPMFMEVKFNGSTMQKMTFSEVVLNPEIDKAMFSMPKKD